MIFRLKTSKKTMEIFDYIYQRDYLQPFALSKIAIALAIRDKFVYDGTNKDSNGLDLNRQTITGEHDTLFKKLIEMNENRYIPEEEYFPNYVKAYIDYGASLLEHEYKYTNDIFSHLVQLDKGI